MPHRAPAAAAAAALAVLLAVGAARASSMADLLPGERALAPLVRSGEIGLYGPDDLWEKINGEAELYRRFGVRGAASALYAAGDATGRRVEVTVFELSDPLHAFGVFASFRSPDDRILGIGSAAVLRDYQGFFRQGSHFVLADAFGPDGDRPGDLRRALEVTASELPAAGGEPPLLAAFELLVRPGTAVFQPDHLLGREALPPGLEGETGDGIRIFVASRPAGGETLDAYESVLGESRRLPVIGGAVGLAGRDPAVGPVILAARGGRLAGACASFPAAGLERTLNLLLDLDPGSE